MTRGARRVTSIKALNTTIGFKLKKYEDLHCQMCCDCLWYCEGIHLFIYDWQPLATWRPGDRTRDLATCWRPVIACCQHAADTGWGWRLLLATTGDHWRPGDLATCWRPAGDFCWRPGDPGLNKRCHILIQYLLNQNNHNIFQYLLGWQPPIPILSIYRY